MHLARIYNLSHRYFECTRRILSKSFIIVSLSHFFGKPCFFVWSNRFTPSTVRSSNRTPSSRSQTAVAVKILKPSHFLYRYQVRWLHIETFLHSNFSPIRFRKRWQLLHEGGGGGGWCREVVKGWSTYKSPSISTYTA